MSVVKPAGQLDQRLLRLFTNEMLTIEQY